MDIIEKSIPNTYEFPILLNNYLNDNTRFVIFDIETTGLSPKFNRIILIGILYFENNNIKITQYFAKSYDDEKEILLAFINELKNFDSYITFNGSSFDIPFINKRLKKYNIPYEIDNFHNLDILRIVKSNKDILGLKDFKLKTIEKFLGIEREDTISGRKSIELYKAYLNSKNNQIKNKILLHNYEDILHLVPTLKILDYLTIDRIFKFLPNEIKIFPDKSVKARISKYKINGDFIDISGNIIGNIDKDFISYNEGYSCTISKREKEFNIKLPILNIKLPNDDTYYFINIDEIDVIEGKLKELNKDKRNGFLIKENNNYKEENIFNSIKFFMSEMSKKILD